MRHHTKDKGDLAVGQVIADLTKHGIQVCLPISEHLPFDLIAVSPSMRDVRRVQVTYVAMKNGAISVNLRRSHADRHGVHVRRLSLAEIDVFAIFCPQQDTVYYVRSDEIPAGLGRQVVLRVIPSRNGQTKGTRPVRDFVGAGRIFGPVAQWTEPAASTRLGGGSNPSGPSSSQRAPSGRHRLRGLQLSLAAFSGDSI